MPSLQHTGYSAKFLFTLTLLLLGTINWISTQPYRSKRPLRAIQDTQTGHSNASDHNGKTPSTIAATVLAPTPAEPMKAVRARVGEQYGKLPLSFERNRGQVDGAVKFLTRGNGYNLFLTATEAVLTLTRVEKVKLREKLSVESVLGDSRDAKTEPAVLRMKLLGAKADAEVTGHNEQSGKSNYFLGNDPAKWRTNVPHYSRVHYGSVYPGVDLVYYGSQLQLEYDFVISPGSSPDKIKMAFEGANEIVVDTDGALRLKTAAGELRQQKPVIYQTVSGARKEVSGRYRISDKHEIGFEVAEYDRKYPLVIDPVLSYASYLGGSRREEGYGIAVDSFGNAYVVGLTESPDFPTVNSRPPGNDYEVFVTKVHASGSAMVYSTYLGGRGSEQGAAIAVDSSGHAFVTGITNSSDFPISPIPSAGAGGARANAFVTKLSPEGSTLVYSTLLGGNEDDLGLGIAIDSGGSAYVTGQTSSSDFPAGNGGQPPLGNYHSGGDAFITKVNPAGTSLVYSVFVGGTGYDDGRAIAVDSAGSAYITGATHSTDFPTANALQPHISGTCPSPTPIARCFEAFVTKLNPAGSAFVYSTYLGGDFRDEGHGIAVDSFGNAYVTGETSSLNFPVTANAFQPAISETNGGPFIPNSDAFVTKFNAAGTALVYSTYLGGTGESEPVNGIALARDGSAYVAGSAGSQTFPILDAFQPHPTGGGDAFITKLNPGGTALTYSTFLGGVEHDLAAAIAIDTAGNAYITGRTMGSFPTERPFQPVFGGGGVNGTDAFVAKIGNAPIAELPPLAISTVTPGRGGNSGVVTVSVYGSGFKNGATIKLVRAGQPDITAASVGVSEDSFIARARFDLIGHSPGMRDIVLTNPDGNSVNRVAAFSVEEGGRPQMWVDIIGRDEFRPGRPQTYYIAYGNRGNIDATVVPINIAMPREAQYELGFKLFQPEQPTEGQTFDFNQIPAHYETATEKIIPLLIGFVPAGSSDFLKIRVTGADQPLRLVVRVKIHPSVLFAATTSHAAPCSVIPNESTPQDGVFGLGDCFDTILTRAFGCLIGFIPGEGCTNAGVRYLTATVHRFTTREVDRYNGNSNSSRETMALNQQFVGGIITSSLCAGSLTPFAGQMIAAMNCGFAENAIENDCPNFGPFTWIAEKITIPLLSRDPNDKVGSLGVGVNHYISGEEPLRYSIEFENVESATAPAQDVVVTDQLDAAKLDFDTFSLGPISFGKDKQVIPPAGLSEFKRDIDLRPEKDLVVRVEAKLDKTTGLLTWRFTSLDPDTGLPTEDPTAGFLPPNHTVPEGEAQVLFTVQAKSDVATGTKVRNKARIVFDANAPIDTPEWMNTIDNSKPTSHVQSLPATVSYSFVVSWAGTDTGAGIDSYTIFVSEDGGTFVPWLANTQATSAVFTGSANKNYRFLSIARDAVGNEEGAKTNAEATTTVSVPAGNAIDDASFFVSQHYRDFLNREPDPSGFLFWTNEINSCGTNAQCLEVKRVNVSAAFYLSIEFQNTGYMAYRTYKSAYGNMPGAPVPLRIDEFLPDTQEIGKGVVVGQTGWEQQLENNKQAFALDFVTRTRFIALYPTTMTPSQFVDALFANAGVTPSTTDRNAAINEFGGAGDTADAAARGRALRRVAENSILNQQETNKAFVLMQYFGYLRRNPNDAPEPGLNFNGYNFWLGKLNQFNGNFVNAEMVKAFIVSGEYRQRFGP
jgi:hypothetical protein